MWDIHGVCLCVGVDNHHIHKFDYIPTIINEWHLDTRTEPRPLADWRTCPYEHIRGIHGVYLFLGIEQYHINQFHSTPTLIS